SLLNILMIFEHRDKKLFGELIDELNKAVKSFSERAEVRLTKLQHIKLINFCRLCEVSGRSDAKFEHFRIEKKLRNLNMYNKKPANLLHGPSLLPDFLKNLIKCLNVLRLHLAKSC
uniref:Uncharacterized protein n=2 Tax=Cyprinus carpio TaxID=7962 RepID=A0A8C1RDZ1_CYPCA